MSTFELTCPRDLPPEGVHHAAARGGNDVVADAASVTLAAVLGGCVLVVVGGFGLGRTLDALSRRRHHRARLRL